MLNLLNGLETVFFYTSQLAGPTELICYHVSVEFFVSNLLGSLSIRSAKTDHTLVFSVESIKLKKIRESLDHVTFGHSPARDFRFCFG